MADSEDSFMRLALDLAAEGRGAVEPNPMVGAVIVRDGAEIARGRHRRFGGPHAEIEALNAARAAGADVRGATMVVTLEPCCHHGKTPPCTDALIAAGIGRVVVAMEDPDSHVAGRGTARLREAGIETVTGVLETEARELLAPYVKLRKRGRPWVICKWAQTADGFLALPPREGRWVSGEVARTRVHELRGFCDGILVGVGTVLADDPLLTNRGGRGRTPTRVVLDTRLRTPPNSRLVRTARRTPLVVAAGERPAVSEVGRADALRHAGAEILPLPRAGGRLDLNALLDELGRRRWTNLLVEGGAETLRSFVAGGLADELVVFVSPRTVGAAGRELPHFDIADLRGKPGWRGIEEGEFGDDRMIRMRKYLD